MTIEDAMNRIMILEAALVKLHRMTHLVDRSGKCKYPKCEYQKILSTLHYPSLATVEIEERKNEPV